MMTESASNDLSCLYQAIDQKGRRAILKNEFTDPYLNHEQPDHRRGLTLLAHLPIHVGRNIGYAQQKLHLANPNLYYYPLKDLHLTVLDLIGAYDGFSISPHDLAAYQKALQNLMAKSKPFDVTLKGLIASPAGILATGYYSDELTMLRQNLRHQLTDKLPVAERYPTCSGHVTVARFKAPLKAPPALLADLMSMQQLQFGTFTVDRLDLVIHDWYNHDVKKIAEYALMH
ncbi:2'-5' RNA ligase family protein [Limosilactobacillus mucosae]|uniref:2'-5' RNA ligase family protein n=1 Tax=Limosilactobacillus mucosae TaxID=97478 RepID=A0AAJ1HT61_LIMMU|nr:2'-5' RNA ligase family protein [Limosilactobacillus mucosae]MDC2830228.1 2'-5' RNA ligase family protein [Limosilactobacillus mucosae]MDC2837800.1 2'-5' RNA ligase family protein [Limosilactobacillus mucosae]MDC2849815.1 2'-5' RNA ligase family protein [Limosilactobacillus mucosae]MDC2853952.1 2'-5' RNA ligase family protein [Limosilactobacillus mucosae]